MTLWPAKISKVQLPVSEAAASHASCPSALHGSLPSDTRRVWTQVQTSLASFSRAPSGTQSRQHRFLLPSKYLGSQQRGLSCRCPSDRSAELAWGPRRGSYRSRLQAFYSPLFKGVVPSAAFHVHESYTSLRPQKISRMHSKSTN